MAGGYQDLNRPVHLARRDACVEHVVELLYAPRGGAGIRERLRQSDRIVRLIDGARRHAILAMRSNRAPENERAFERFLRLVLENARSVHTLMENQSHIELEDHSFLAQLLGEEQEEALLSALHCRRSAEDMLMGLAQILRMAHGPYRVLQQENVAALRGDDQLRYTQARKSFLDQLEEEYPPEGSRVEDEDDG